MGRKLLGLASLAPILLVLLRSHALLHLYLLHLLLLHLHLHLLPAITRIAYSQIYLEYSQLIEYFFDIRRSMHSSCPTTATVQHNVKNFEILFRLVLNDFP